jgi:hypothetical protein
MNTKPAQERVARRRKPLNPWVDLALSAAAVVMAALLVSQS